MAIIDLQSDSALYNDYEGVIGFEEQLSLAVDNILQAIETLQKLPNYLVNVSSAEASFLEAMINFANGVKDNLPIPPDAMTSI